MKFYNDSNLWFTIGDYYYYYDWKISPMIYIIYKIFFYLSHRYQQQWCICDRNNGGWTALYLRIYVRRSKYIYDFCNWKSIILFNFVQSRNKITNNRNCFQKFQMRMQFTVDGLRTMKPFYHMNRHYIFAGTYGNNTIFRIVKQGPQANSVLSP